MPDLPVPVHLHIMAWAGHGALRERRARRPPEHRMCDRQRIDVTLDVTPGCNRRLIFTPRVISPRVASRITSAPDSRSCRLCRQLEVFSIMFQKKLLRSRKLQPLQRNQTRGAPLYNPIAYTVALHPTTYKATYLSLIHISEPTRPY